MEKGQPMKIEAFELKGISVDIPSHSPLNLDKKHLRDGSRKSVEENSNEEAESQMRASQIQQVTPLYSEILDGLPPRVAGKVIIHCIRHPEVSFFY
jgi:hypothetical protein